MMVLGVDGSGRDDTDEQTTTFILCLQVLMRLYTGQCVSMAGVCVRTAWHECKCALAEVVQQVVHACAITGC